jgi:Flp pilus assembly protein TadD
MFEYRFRIYICVAAFCAFSFPVIVVDNVHAQGQEPLVIKDGDSESSIPSVGELNTVDAQEEIEPVKDSNTISAPSVIAENMDEDVFFDAEDLVPQGEMARRGPVPVNPRTQPASKFISVTKNKSGNSKDAKFVAAERAMALGRYDSALSILDVLYEKSSKDSRVLLGRATTLQKLGRFDEAMQMYEKLEALEPNNIDVKVNMLGLLSTRYPSVALRKLLVLHNENKSHVGIVSQLAIAYAKAGDAQSAISYLGAAAAQDPKNAGHLFNMAVISDRAGRTDDAIKYYEKALEVDTIHGAGRSIPRDSVYERLSQIRS